MLRTRLSKPDETSRQASASSDSRDRPWLGAGRSGTVYLESSGAGPVLACKVFGSRGVIKLVQWLFLGSPNPYIWCEDAVRAACLRRMVLAKLVEIWFGDRLKVSRAFGYAWNEDARAYEIRTEYSPGRPAELHHPLRTAEGDEARELVRACLRPLQRRLREAGFVGQVWQAGMGNPVALDNFLLEPDAETGAEAGAEVGGSRERGRWTWIDLESGVPALPALGPAALLGFYLPWAIRLRRPLFDEVATRDLRAYLEREARSLREALGAEGHRDLLAEVDELERRQRRWKVLSRLERGVAYRLRRGDISEEEAARYLRRPLRWYARESRRAIAAGPRLFVELGSRLATWWKRFDAKGLLRAAARFASSQRFRARVAREYLALRIRSWTDRGQMSAAHADFLRSRLESEESSAYLTDFGIHVAIKPFVKSVEYWLFPALFATGMIGAPTLAIAILVGGALGRSLYTGGRLVQSLLRGRERPWVALAVGVVPIVGNFAYPVQLLYSSTDEDDALARFILYDGFTRLGRKIPVWGGADSLTEHFFNRLPDRLPVLRRAREPVSPQP